MYRRHVHIISAEYNTLINITNSPADMHIEILIDILITNKSKISIFNGHFTYRKHYKCLLIDINIIILTPKILIIVLHWRQTLPHCMKLYVQVCLCCLMLFCQMVKKKRHIRVTFGVTGYSQCCCVSLDGPLRLLMSGWEVNYTDSVFDWRYSASAHSQLILTLFDKTDRAVPCGGWGGGGCLVCSSFSLEDAEHWEPDRKQSRDHSQATCWETSPEQRSLSAAVCWSCWLMPETGCTSIAPRIVQKPNIALKK